VELVCAVSPLLTKNCGIRTGTGWFALVIICTNGVTRVSANGCYIELVLYIRMIAEMKHEAFIK
jgi:hypothetical protein